MIKSMYSGITGLKANQTKLDVIGNNIANVGTTSFKSQRVNFKDALSQTINSSSAAGYNTGGTNASQVGLGVQLGSIVTNMAQGNLQTTGSNLDVAVDGDGFFIVARGPVPVSNTSSVSVDSTYHTMGAGNGLEVSYTRDGSFALDSEGNLLTADGFRVMGYPLSEKGGNIASIDYSSNGVCNFVDSNSAKGIVASSENLVPLKISDTVHVTASNYNDYEMTYTGSGKVAEVSPIKISTNGIYTKNDDLNINITFNAEDSMYMISVNGNSPIKLENANSYLDATTGIKETVIGADGNATEKNLTLADLGITIDGLDAYSGVQTDTLTAKKNSFTTTVYAEADIKIRNFSIEKDGVIKGVLEDGRVTVFGQIAMASFKNPAGLEKTGNNLYSVSSNSGNPVVRSATGCADADDNSAGFGSTLNGYLEMSNVDLSEQFTEMIVASRAFQASSKAITTGDEILQELVNLKR